MTREEKLIQLRQLKRLQALKAQQQQSAPPQAAPPQDMGGYLNQDSPTLDKIKHGVALSGVETGLGIKDIFTDLTPENERVLKMMRADADRAGGWSDFGQAAGEILQLAVPASRAARVTKLAPIAGLSNLKKAMAVMGAEGALGAGFGGLQALDEGETRAGNALEGGILSAAGAGAGQLLSKAARGIKQSEAAKYLTDMGVRLTPGQAAKSGLPQAMEYAMSIMPGTAKQVARQKDLAQDSFSKSMLQEAAPRGTTIKQTGYDGMNELKNAYKSAYRSEWNKAGRLDDSVIVKMIGQADEADAFSSEAKAPVRRIRQKVEQYIDDKSTANLDTLDDQIRKEIARVNNAQYPDRDLIDMFDEMRETLKGGTSVETQEGLAKLNEQYGKFKVVEKAAGSLGGMKSGEGLQGGYFGGDELAGAVKALGQGRQAYGKAPLQTAAKAAQETISRKDPIPLMNFVRGLSKKVEIPLISKPVLGFGADAMMGRTAAQKKGQALANALRDKGITGGSLGYAQQGE